MKYLALVRKVARELNLLDDRGQLGAVDSISAIDLVVALESAAQKPFPIKLIRPQTFSSLEGIAGALEAD